MATTSEATNSRKRKSDASASTSKGKKARTSVGALLDAILSNPLSYEISDDKDAVRRTLVEIAQYAQSLEHAAANGGGPVPQPKTRQELEDAAEKIRKAAVSGIKKQMKWRDSCKTGTAKWSYDGICPDPEVFGVMLNLGGPPKFKNKKFPTADFEDLIGDISVSIRYDTLKITSNDVNVHWKDGGEFKFSGTYGK
ncbi:hypothetical protein JAAARDRAFT_118704 [Jaapia argillacea MUCL 33604]|uniref:Uncharacterized protein n=1 Tax=Jaapia argillacea MUCL 33604 TaxID=933084 RepID=A0A067QBN9_9AGAM|nr:hypothetical protein JAAARDRAFT_118704 [Jaapia argillacea MUCL 33604]